MQSNQPSVSIPQYTPPNPTNFNTSYGNLNYANGAYNYTSANPADDQEMATLRDALGSSLNATGPGGVQNTQDWQTAFSQAALKNAAPALSNQLFSAGLGGSSAYGTAMGDLYSNVGTQAVLNGQNLNLANTQSNQNSFNAVNSAYGQNQNYGLGLSQLGANYNSNANAQAQQLYGMQLPYLSTVNNNQGAGYGQIIGAGLGAAGGAFMGNPILGAQIGSSVGGGVDSGMGNTSVGGGLINGGLSGLSALQGAGFFSPSPLQATGTTYGAAMPTGGGGNSGMGAWNANNAIPKFSVFK